MQRKFSTPKTALSRPPVWNEIAVRFADARDCLASYLALESAEVVAGVKPGNLVNIVNRRRHCGRNPYELWLAHGAALLAGTGLEALELRDRGDSLLLYIYRPGGLQELLSRRAVRICLEKCAYPDPADPDATLAELKARLAAGEFPHEVGIFLGYPLKDVLAFMGRIPIPFACQGPWKIYGNPRESLALAATFRRCRQRMARDLAVSRDPLSCLRQAA